MSKTAEAQADSVGALLRQSRELKGLSTADVATHLRLKVSQIEQIEAEQWDPAVSATFMRGYLRAYARLLKLSETEILQNFELQTAYLRNQAKPMHSFSRKNRLDAVDNRFMLATYLLVVLMIGLFLVWFWQTHWLDSQPVSVVPEYRVSGEPATMPDNSSQGDVASARPAATELTTSAAAVTSAAEITTSTADEPVVVKTDTPTDAPVAGSVVNRQSEATEVVPVNTTPSADQTTSTLTTAEPVTAESVTTEPQLTNNASTALSTEQAVVGSTAQLQLTFSAECWVTVQDATGARLAYGIKSAGQSLLITGQLPFSVTLGNAAAATLQLNQTAVDLSGYKAGQVARLTLDGQP